MNKNNKMWGGRFSMAPSTLMEHFSSSVQFDHKLYKEDIRGSIAHARMLSTVGILTPQEFSQIEAALQDIYQEIEQGTFNFSIKNEDIHMNIEATLTARIGDTGKKLHTARSRNDQVATDMRLFVRSAIDQIGAKLGELQQALITLAEQESDTIMPGLTHLQPAQPITLGHHLLAWNAMFQRDYERFMDSRKRANICPLGSAALAGTSFPIDREMTANELGFDSSSENSLDAVSDRDFIIEFNANAAMAMIHFSRIAEELIIWSSSAFNFIDLGDAFCTGSSIMPQKKNPDMAELTRGKSARVVGNLMAILTLMKAQPLAYNRDNQEDKEQLFDSIDTLLSCISLFAEMIPAVVVNREAMYQAALAGFTTATDLADYLVRKNLPFRDAHEIVGEAVKYAQTLGCDLSKLSLSQLQKIQPDIEQDVFDVLTLEGSVNARNHLGGTAPVEVKKAVVRAREQVNSR